METNQGDVAIDGVGTLRCTLGAAKAVNNYFGGFISANDALARMDFSATCAVVAAGLGKSVADIEETVFRAGQADIHAKVRKYLDLLANNGRVYVEPAEPAKPDASGNG